jgi:hypothetical protein
MRLKRSRPDAFFYVAGSTEGLTTDAITTCAIWIITIHYYIAVNVDDFGHILAITGNLFDASVALCLDGYFLGVDTSASESIRSVTVNVQCVIFFHFFLSL